MAPAVEVWDDDGDLQGDVFASGVLQPSFSSRQSIRSESNAAEEEWNLPLSLDDENSTAKAISSANSAGIPIPKNVPASALLGDGSIKRLGKKKSRQNIRDDWGDDLDVPNSTGGGLKLKPRQPAPATPGDGMDDFEDWAEGSLGTRFGGTRREMRNRSSSVSAMSPSMGSIMTLESEEDGMDGLVLPSGPLDFEIALLKQREAFQAETNTKAVPSGDLPRTTEDSRDNQKDDFFSGIDFGAGDVFNSKKLTLNRNIKLRSTKPAAPATRTQTTLTFTDKQTSTRIPRPVISSKPSRLEPVLESGASSATRPRRPEPTTTSAQLLRSKRSMPVLRSQHIPSAKSPPVPYLPAGSAQYPRSSHHNLRRESDPSRAQSPPNRSFSRLSNSHIPETPTRLRRDVAPTSLTREGAAKKTMTRPARRRNFGDGTELETFDDLPTSAAKETKYTKPPSTRPAPKTLRNQPSLSKFPPRDKMTTPLPNATPRSPTKTDNLPRFARDTTASRIAREQKLGSTRPRGEGPLMPIRQVNWQAQVAARTPHSSPTAHKSQRKGPTLIRQMNQEVQSRTEKGMTWNPTLFRWEGNENALTPFDVPAPPPSPPRPALITNISGAQGVQVVGGMVFDPQRMCWLKMGATQSEPMSPSIDDDDDPFKGIEDLPETKPGADTGSTSGTRGVAVGSEWLIGEEFDLGPDFIRRQRDEELNWQAKTGLWFKERYADDGYKYALRSIARGCD